MTSATVDLPPAVTPADGLLLGFARALRAAGVPVTPDRSATFLAAVAAAGLGERAATYWAGRATLCACPDDLERYDQVFLAWFGAEALGAAAPAPTSRPRPQTRVEADAESAADGGPDDTEELRVAASTVEILRHRDVAALTPAERRWLAEVLSALRPRVPQRRATRLGPSYRGRLDPHRTLRAQLRQMGEPAALEWRRRRSRPRRVVLLVDVSGSMSPYADVLLRVAHRYVRTGAPAEVFTVGTRLTRVTRALRQRDPDRALHDAGQAVPDWSGGTRLAETLGVFVQQWGRRGAARGAVVVVCSDGWERG
ncbi:MAG TPA: VWA domain-containing protein, partial [Candidatus Lustribacter sp.]|nr:VWA domain-containing protein [Candidatus Lustribacter sp.]